MMLMGSAIGTVLALPTLSWAQARRRTRHRGWLAADSSALVLLMTPGLALFYAGMVRRKNVLGTMMHSFYPDGCRQRALGTEIIAWLSMKAASGAASVSVS
jgi:hypothetical protein